MNVPVYAYFLNRSSDRSDTSLIVSVSRLIDD